MASNEPFWKSDPTSLGLRVHATLHHYGVVLTLERREVWFGKEQDKPSTASWLVASQLAVWWPNSIEQAMRQIVHWLDFFDTSLKSQIAPVLQKLSTLEDAPTTGEPPQGKGDLN